MDKKLFFSKLLIKENLTELQSRGIFTELFSRKLSENEAKLLLLLLAQKGETAEEITGCLKAIRRFEPAFDAKIPHLIDTCGTGGDGSHSFNISTVSAFIIAGAGGHVAKHGNRAISSKTGSSDLMEALGVKLDAPFKRMVESVKKNGIGYFHAPLHHPTFSTVQPLRRKLRIRTIFNYLGPLLNPLKVEAQLIGIAKSCPMTLYTRAVKSLSLRHALLVQSKSGMDEISSAEATNYVMITKDKILSGIFHPQKWGISKSSESSLKGQGPKQNAARTIKILQNKEQSALRTTLILNAAAGLMVSGIANDMPQGIHLAEESLCSGRALQSLKGLISTSHKR